MIIVNHRVNDLEKLRSTPRDCGVEIDLRCFGGRLVLNHEPFLEGVDFDMFLSEYDHAILILNIKCEGIEQRALDLIRKFGVKNFFFLDVTFPFMVKYFKQGLRQFAVRFSEYESINTCLTLKGLVDWVFVDNFTHLPIENDSFRMLSKHFKLCIVSPELLHRDEVEETKRIVRKYAIQAVLTDHIGRWRD